MGQCPAYSRIRGDTLGTYYDSINNIMDNNNIDLIINFALKTKRHTHPHTIHPLYTSPSLQYNPIHHYSSTSSPTLIPADLSVQNQALSPCGIILTWTSVQGLFYIWLALTSALFCGRARRRFSPQTRNASD